MSKTKNKVGRPPKLNENTVKKLEEIFRWWWSVTQACLYAGISRDVFYEWINKKDEFSDKKCKDFINRIELAKEYPNMACKRIILKEWMKWNWKAAAWWLERKDPEFFWFYSFLIYPNKGSWDMRVNRWDRNKATYK